MFPVADHLDTGRSDERRLPDVDLVGPAADGGVVAAEGPAGRPPDRPVRYECRVRGEAQYRIVRRTEGDPASPKVEHVDRQRTSNGVDNAAPHATPGPQRRTAAGKAVFGV